MPKPITVEKKIEWEFASNAKAAYQLDSGAAKTKSVYAHFITGKTAFNLNLS
jgi:hypothetical protein